MSALLGYARVSTADQSAALQDDALRAAGCHRVWTDTASGARTDRPQLAELFDHLRAGGTDVGGVAAGPFGSLAATSD